MGIWGINLYQCDTSLDVKEQFEKLLRDGISVKEITDRLINDYRGSFDNPTELCSFWLALADTQWKWGRLLPDVKEYALQIIANGGDIDQWNNKGSKVVEQRFEVMDSIRNELLSPQPHAKRIVKSRLYQCKWNIGDVYAFQLESDKAKTLGLLGQYYLLRHVDMRSWHPGHTIPIVNIKITKDGRIPSTIEEFNALEYIQTGFTRYEDRFFPIDARRAKEDIAEKSKLKYDVDEYGVLPEFRVGLVTVSEKMIPTKLIYVDCFEKVLPPPKEFVPHSKQNIDCISWKNKDKDFESVVLERYCRFNLKEHPLYSASRGRS